VPVTRLPVLDVDQAPPVEPPPCLHSRRGGACGRRSRSWPRSRPAPRGPACALPCTPFPAVAAPALGLPRAITSARAPVAAWSFPQLLHCGSILPARQMVPQHRRWFFPT